MSRVLQRCWVGACVAFLSIAVLGADGQAPKAWDKKTDSSPENAAESASSNPSKGQKAASEAVESALEGRKPAKDESASDGSTESSETYKLLVRIIDGEVTRTYGADLEAAEQKPLQSSHSFLCKGRTVCGMGQMPGRLPSELAYWLALMDLHMQLNQGADAGTGVRFHTLNSMSKDRASTTEGNKSQEASRELIVFEPADGIRCAGQVKLYRVGEVPGMAGVDRSQLQKLGVMKASHQKVKRRRRLGISATPTGQAMMNHQKREKGGYQLKIHTAMDYESDHTGQAVMAERVLRCRADRPIKAEKLGSYGRRVKKTDEGMWNVSVTPVQGSKSREKMVESKLERKSQ